MTQVPVTSGIEEGVQGAHQRDYTQAPTIDTSAVE